MIKKVATGFVCVLALALAGCGTLGELFVSGTNAAYVFDQNGSLQETITKADLTQEEVNTVNEAQVVILTLRTKFSSVTSLDLLTLGADYLKAKDAYASVYTIVEKHWDEYTPDEQKAFTDVHTVAADLDSRVSTYIETSSAYNGTNTMVQYLVTIGKLGTLL